MKKTIFIVTVAIAGLGLFMACEPAATNTANSNTNVANTTNSANANAVSNYNATISNDSNTTKGENPIVGGAEMSVGKNIIENASNSKDHTKLVEALKKGDLAETLEGDGPFTVFAPTDEAFGNLPKETTAELTKDGNKVYLRKVLTYHVVAGKLDAESLAKMIKDGDGKAMIRTVEGENISVSLEGDKVVITDARGGKATVTISDVMQSNGVIHVIDSVLMPK